MKARMVQLTEPAEIEALEDANARGDLAAPMIVLEKCGISVTLWADAEELRAWRLQHTSEGPP